MSNPNHDKEGKFSFAKGDKRPNATISKQLNHNLRYEDIQMDKDEGRITEKQARNKRVMLERCAAGRCK
jgi:hypothetical protein